MPNCKHSITSSSYFGLSLENKSDISFPWIETPEKFRNNCFENGMVRHLNNLLNFYSYWFKKSMEKNTQVFIQERKTIQYIETNVEKSTSEYLQRHCFINTRQLFLHALLWLFSRIKVPLFWFFSLTKAIRRLKIRSLA